MQGERALRLKLNENLNENSRVGHFLKKISYKVPYGTKFLTGVTVEAGVTRLTCTTSLVFLVVLLSGTVFEK